MSKSSSSGLKNLIGGNVGLHSTPIVDINVRETSTTDLLSEKARDATVIGFWDPVDPIVSFSFPIEQTPEDLRSTKDITGDLEDIVDSPSPDILLLSEFLPLYNNDGKESDVYKNLSLKEVSRTINQNLSSKELSTNAQSHESALAKKQQLLGFLDQDKTFLTDVLKNTSRLVTQLSIRDYYESKTSKNRFREFLQSRGYEKRQVDLYSSTKLWHQTLVELKKELVAYSTASTRGSATRTPEARVLLSDTDPYLLSDIDVDSSTARKYWINNLFRSDRGQLTLDSLRILPDNAETTKYLVDYALSAYDKLYVDAKTGKSIGTDNLDLVTGNSEASLSLIVSILTRELNFSCFIENGNATEYGYTPNLTSDNIKVWDYVVGKFPKSIYDFTDSPEDSNSLSSTAQSIYKVPGENGSQKTIKVLTFENSKDDKQPDVTPGSSYHVDGFFRPSSDGNFNASRIESLSAKIERIKKTTSSLIDITSPTTTLLDAQVTYRKNEEKYYSSTYMTDKVYESLKPITNIYAKRTTSLGNEGQPIIEKTDFSPYESQIRNVGLLSKLAVAPPTSLKNLSRRVRAILFAYVISSYLKKTRAAEAAAFQLSDVFVNSKKVSKTAPPNREDVVIAKTTNNTQDLTDSSSVGAINLLSSTEVIEKAWIQKVTELADSMLNIESTAYAGVDPLVVLLSYFDILVRSTASLIPESIQSVSEYKDNSSPPLTNTVISLSVSNITDIKDSYFINYVGVNGRTDLSVESSVIPSQAVYEGRSSLYSQAYRKVTADTYAANNALRDIITIVANYAASLQATLTDLRTTVSNAGSSTGYYSTLRSILLTDPDVTPNNVNNITARTFTKRQLSLLLSSIEDVKDRYSNSDSIAKLKNFLLWSSSTNEYSDVLPKSDLELISFSILSPTLSSNSFRSLQGINKKILTVGIPPQLQDKIMQSLPSTDTLQQKLLKRNFVRIKLYRSDKIYPGLIHKGKEYTFQLNRYPTRSLSNWANLDLDFRDASLLQLPTRVIDENGASKTFENYAGGSGSTQGLDTSFPTSMSFEERREIYRNHSKSLICEEYFRWFSDCRIDETRYWSNARVTTDNPVLTQQTANTSAFNLDASLKDTLDAYFSTNETLFLDIEEIQRSLLYPKKYDRVYSILFDPDDFEIDYSLSATRYTDTLGRLIDNTEEFRSLVEAGIVVPIDAATNRYKRGNFVPGDVSFDEYFVTVESYF